MSFLPQVLIRKKREGEPLEDEELHAFVAGITDGSIPDYQAAAMLMAIFFRGLTDRELAAWADAMLHSGDVLDLSSIDRPKIDKHSTGGVGDKVSLPLAPAVAACGIAVPMVSGRGLGHTGGTLDKLESIPGFRVHLSVDRFVRQVDDLGVCMIGQTEKIAPADRHLYALRDVTATVESIPLIASSIMSKKLAEGIDGLVLDVKVGRGAFMTRRESARELAHAMRVIGEAAGKRVSAVLTDMNAPIGRMVGNALEVAESIEVLRGGGPADTRELVVRLGAEMLLLGGAGKDAEETKSRIEEVLDSGAALEVFEKMVVAQGGDPRVVEAPDEVLPGAPERTPIPAPRAGFLASIGSRDVGVAALHLGAGRRTKEDRVDHAVGVELPLAVGAEVAAGDPIAWLHHAGRGVKQARELLTQAIEVADSAEAAETRILEVLR